MKINNIYPAFMGEVNKFGIGAPCVFVRTAGCNLRCYWKTLGCLCDTPEALSAKGAKEMTPAEIVEEVKKYNIPLVCLTGGEPLMQSERELKILFLSLEAAGISVVVETNGSCSIHPFLEFTQVTFVVDYKGVSSGENDRMTIGNWQVMREDDWLKFVIYNEADIEDMLRWCEHHKDFKGKIAAGLFWGSPKVSYGVSNQGIEVNQYRKWNLLEQIIKNYPQYHIHLNMQTHKLIILYEHMRGDEVDKIIAPRDL